MTDDCAVVLLSGGIDSAVAAADLARHGTSVWPLFVHYGQRCVDREFAAAVAISKHLGLRPVRRIDADMLLQLKRGESQDTWRHSFLPQRNLWLLAVAGMYASSIGMDCIAIGLVRDDHRPVPDTTRRFLATAQEALAVSTPDLLVMAPLIRLTKLQVVRRARRIGVDLALTESCMAAGPGPCGHCRGCVERAEVFAAAGEMTTTVPADLESLAPRPGPGIRQ